MYSWRDESSPAPNLGFSFLIVVFMCMCAFAAVEFFAVRVGVWWACVCVHAGTVRPRIKARGRRAHLARGDRTAARPLRAGQERAARQVARLAKSPVGFQMAAVSK